MKRYKELRKLGDSLDRKLKKYEKMDYLKYVNLFLGQYFEFKRKDGRDGFVLVTEYNLKHSDRINLVKILQQTNYHRGDNIWTEVSAIGFMTEVMNYYLFSSDFYSYYIEDNSQILCPLEEIEERYNVKQNRFKTQVALFLMNLNKGNDKFNILKHFTQLDLLLWKYRDNNPEQIQEDIEKQVLTEDTLELMRKLFNLEG